MNFRKRLIIAFILMTLFPMALLVSLGAVILKYQSVTVKQDYEVEVDGIQMIQNPIQLLNRLTRGIYNELQSISEDSPEQLLEENYLKETNERLQNRQAFLVVIKDDETVFCGNREVYEVLLESLPKSGVYSVIIDGGLYVNGRIPCLVKQQSFAFTDGTEGVVMVISDASTLMPQLRNSLIQVVHGGTIIFFGTGFLAILWLYAGVVKPINKLKKATNRVKDGDLNFSLEKTGNDEIGELSADFEEMRAHLKEEIDARIKYEEDLRNLIGNISHDLKTPLTTIKGYSEGLLDGVAATPEKQEKYIRTIRSKAEDMTVMIEELSLYAKIESKAYPYYFEQVGLIGFFSDFIEEDAPMLEEKNISLVLCNRLTGSDKVNADREQLKRVVTNIIGNTMKYLGKEKGTITVTLFEKDNLICTRIEDDGVGIPAADLPHIFERFYRGDVSRNSGKGGSGLGLSIAKQIIEDHCGTIEAESTEGKGTAISFTLQRTCCSAGGKRGCDGKNTDN